MLRDIGTVFREAYSSSCEPLTSINGFKKTDIWPFNPGVLTEVDFCPAEMTDHFEPNKNGSQPTQSNAEILNLNEFVAAFSPSALTTFKSFQICFHSFPEQNLQIVLCRFFQCH